MMRPNRAEILEVAKTCGLAEENLVFSVDDDNVDNADVYPLGERTDQYWDSVERLMGWAEESGAAMGFHFAPRET